MDLWGLQFHPSPTRAQLNHTWHFVCDRCDLHDDIADSHCRVADQETSMREIEKRSRERLFQAFRRLPLPISKARTDGGSSGAGYLSVLSIRFPPFFAAIAL